MNRDKKKNLKILPVPVPKADHPDAPSEQLMKHEFTLGLIAPKGAGKTTLIANLLHFYKGYFHGIYIFSPTVLSDDKWDWIKEQKLCIENKPLKEWIAKEKKKREGAFKDQIVQDPPLGKDFDNVNSNKKEEFDARIPEENFYHDYDHTTFADIIAKKKLMINA